MADEKAAEERSGQTVVERVFMPEMNDEERHKLSKRWEKAVESSLGWAH